MGARNVMKSFRTQFSSVPCFLEHFFSGSISSNNIVQLSGFTTPGESFAVEFVIMKHFACESLHVEPEEVGQ